MTAFVADENVPAPSIMILRSAGLDVLSIHERHPATADIEIIRLANIQERLIITCDSDFGELIYRRLSECRTGVIFLRLGDFSPREPAEFVLRYLAETTGIFNGKFSVITRKRIRQRVL